jgi:hypothetical protein
LTTCTGTEFCGWFETISQSTGRALDSLEGEELAEVLDLVEEGSLFNTTPGSKVVN